MPTFYHGTRQAFGPGGWLFPGSQVGIDNHNLGPHDVVYVTPEIDVAWWYADQAIGDGEPIVLVVRPVGWVGADDKDEAGYRCKSARVLRVIRD